MRKFKLLRKNGKSAACQNLRLFEEILVDQNDNKKFLFDFDKCQELLKQKRIKNLKTTKYRKKYFKKNHTNFRIDIKIYLAENDNKKYSRET